MNALEQAIQNYKTAPTADNSAAVLEALRTINPAIDGGQSPLKCLKSIPQENGYLDVSQLKLLAGKFSGPIPTSLWNENLFLQLGSGNLLPKVIEDNIQLGNPVAQIHRSLALQNKFNINGSTAVVPVSNFGTFSPPNNQGPLYVNNGYFGICIATANEGKYIPPNYDGVNKIYNSAIIMEDLPNLTQLCAGRLGNFRQLNNDPWQYSKVVAYSPLGAVVRYFASDSDSSMTAYLVQGCPYVSFSYAGTDNRPTFNANDKIVKISSDNGDTLSDPKVNDTITGKIFTVQYEKSIFKIYSSAEITFKLDKAERYVTPLPQGTISPGDPNYDAGGPEPWYVPVARTYVTGEYKEGFVGKLISSESFNGHIRIASLNGDEGLEKVLDDNHAVIPVAGVPNIISSNQWAYAYECIDLNTGAPTGAPPLIALTKPDVDAFQEGISGASNQIQKQGTKVIEMPSIRGPLNLALGNYLQFKTVQTPPAQWYNDGVNVWSKLPEAAKATFVKQLVADAAFHCNQGLQFSFPQGWEKNTGCPAYTFGKRLLAAAQVCLYLDKVISDIKTSDAQSPYLTELNQAFQSALNGVKKWLGRAVDTGFVYDEKLGTVIETSSQFDPLNANFTNASGQDHVFHYGYFVNAAAIITHFDAGWINTPLTEFPSATYKNVLYALIRDVADPVYNPGACREDQPGQTPSYFPAWRQVNWGEGHANANSINAVLPDGRNEESFAEEINFWHGMQLFGKVTGNESIQNIGAVMRARSNNALMTWMEIGSAASKVVYAPFYGELTKINNLVFANLWSTNIQFNTWFGDATKPWEQNMPFSVGIEVITTIPEMLDSMIDGNWLNMVGEYFDANLLSNYDKYGKGYYFLSILAPMLAKYKPELALKAIQYKNFTLDEGNTLSTLMFNIAYYEADKNDYPTDPLPGFVEPTLYDPGVQGWGPLAGAIVMSLYEYHLSNVMGCVPFLQYYKDKYPELVSAQKGLELLCDVLIPQMTVWSNEVVKYTTTEEKENWIKTEVLPWFTTIESGYNGKFDERHLTAGALIGWNDRIKNTIKNVTNYDNFNQAFFTIRRDDLKNGAASYINTLGVQNPPDPEGVELMKAVRDQLQSMLDEVMKGNEPPSFTQMAEWGIVEKGKPKYSGIQNTAKQFWNGTVYVLSNNDPKVKFPVS